MVRQETWKGRETFAFAECFECAAEAWELVAARPLGDEEIPAEILGIVQLQTFVCPFFRSFDFWNIGTIYQFYFFIQVP